MNKEVEQEVHALASNQNDASIKPCYLLPYLYKKITPFKKTKKKHFVIMVTARAFVIKSRHCYFTEMKGLSGGLITRSDLTLRW